QRAHVEKGMSGRALFGGASGWNAAEVINNARDGGEQARRETSRHQISGNSFQILILRKGCRDSKAPCSREKRKGKRDEHWMNRMRLDRSCAFHARDACKSRAQDALTPTLSRISLSVAAAPSSGRLLM